MPARRRKKWFLVIIREVREGWFLVEAPADATADDVRVDLVNDGPVLGDSVLEFGNCVAAEGHFEPSTEVKVKLFGMVEPPRRGLPRFRMVRPRGVWDDMQARPMRRR